MAETLSWTDTAAGLAGHRSNGAHHQKDNRIAAATLIVENMACGGCMRKVEAALAAVDGVATVRANLSAKRAAITFDAAKASTHDLVDALADAGFKAAELTGDVTTAAGRTEKQLLRRVAIAGFAAANIMLLSVSVWSGGAGDMSPSVMSMFHWLSAVIALPTVAYAGQPFFTSAYSALTAGRLNMDVPISLGVLLATGMSLLQTIQGGGDQVYFDAAVTLLFFLLLGRFLDAGMRSRAQGAAANLLGLRSINASVLQLDGGVITVAAHDLLPGMRVLVSAGERIAVDGRVVDGHGEIDQAIITGESMPVAVTEGDEVFAGSISLNGRMIIEATATDESTLLSEIGRLMMVAEQGRGRYVRLADFAATIYAPAVHLLGLATVLVWLAFGASWQAALTAGIATLIVTCPCALALAVPAVQVAASSRLFARGIIVKAADGLERLAEIDTVVFDKTGTLTLGKPRLNHIIDGGTTELQQAAAIAASSRHPFARALVEAARDRGITVVSADGVSETPGCGLSYETDGGTVRLGSSAWCGVEDTDSAALWLCVPGRPPVGFAFEESLRPDAREVAARLAKAGLGLEILSGDRTAAVGAIAAAVGIAKWQGRQNPAEKINYINSLMKGGRRVLMVGDGLNDAPALAAAHAAVSPANASDISQTTADTIFQGDKLDAVIELIAVAKEARKMALQNFGIALAYNAIFVPLAMAGIVTPLLAAIAMSASSIGVTANALRLRHKSVRIA